MQNYDRQSAFCSPKCEHFKLDLDQEGGFGQNKKTRPKKFYALSNKAIFVKIGS